MKSVIIAIVIFALVIGCAFFITFHFQSFTEKMLHKLDSLPNDMEDLEKTEEKELREGVEEIAALWDEEFQRMVYLVGYSLVNRADSAINTMYTAVCTGNHEDYAINRREAMDALRRLQELQGMRLSAVL